MNVRIVFALLALGRLPLGSVRVNTAELGLHGL